MRRGYSGRNVCSACRPRCSAPCVQHCFNRTNSLRSHASTTNTHTPTPTLTPTHSHSRSPDGTQYYYSYTPNCAHFSVIGKAPLAAQREAATPSTHTMMMMQTLCTQISRPSVCVCVWACVRVPCSVHSICKCDILRRRFVRTVRQGPHPVCGGVTFTTQHNVAVKCTRVCVCV